MSIFLRPTRKMSQSRAIFPNQDLYVVHYAEEESACQILGPFPRNLIYVALISAP